MDIENQVPEDGHPEDAHKNADSWLLCAVLQAGEGTDGATLGRIIEAGDALKQAMFNQEELIGGIERLAAAGLIKFRNETVYSTQKVAPLIETFTKRRDAFKRLEEAEHFLHELPAPVETEATAREVERARQLATSENIREAMKEYHVKSRQAAQKRKGTK